VAIKAKCQACFGYAKHIGIKMTSGWIGKKEASAKLNKNKYFLASFFFAKYIIFE